MTNDAGIDALAGMLGQTLLQKHAVCATAESCTGGLVAGAITGIAGSSAWFDRGFVTYTNEAKADVLGVPRTLIAEVTSVPPPRPAQPTVLSVPRRTVRR